jgi:hypothetical protein
MGLCCSTYGLRRSLKKLSAIEESIHKVAGPIEDFR